MVQQLQAVIYSTPSTAECDQFFYAVADSNSAHAVLLVIMHIMHMHHFCTLCTRTFVITSSCSWNLMELWWKIGQILLQSGKCGNKFQGAKSQTFVASNFNLIRDAPRLCGGKIPNKIQVQLLHWCLNLFMFSNLNVLTKLHMPHCHTSENYMFIHFPQYLQTAL